MHAGKVQPKLGLEVEETQSFFKPASWMTKIQFTQQLIQNNNVIISILSEPNSGKSTFAKILADSISPEITTVLLTANPLFKPDVLLKQMANALECTADNIPELIEQVNSKGGSTLFIIDDAHFLTQTFLKEILEAMQAHNINSFHLALVANFSLTLSLNHLAQLYPDAIHSIELGPLSAKEAESFLRDKFQAYPEADTLLSPERLQEFYELTEGSIVGINTQASAFFLPVSTEKNPKKKIGWILPSVAAGVGVIVFGIVYYLNMIAASSSYSPMEIITELPTPAATVEPAQPIQAKIEEEPRLNSEIPNYTVAANYQSIHPTSLRKINLIDEAAEGTVPVDATYVVMDKVLVIPKVVSPKAATETVVAVNKSHANAKTIAVKASAGNASKPIAATGNAYTIQLLASHKKNELLSFAKAHRIQGKVKIYQAKSGGVSWYVLTYGSYNHRNVAKQAVNALPNSLAKLKPWIRGLSDLKAIG